VRSALLFGLVNAGVALWTTHLLRRALKRIAPLRVLSAAVIAALLAGMVYADRILEIGEGNIYADDIVLSKTTPYQRIVITAWKDDLRLFLNSNLQFSSRDEYRYHEALVHAGLAALPGARHVLVLGGGDGLAVREILKHRHVEDVTVVDLDPEMTRLFSSHPELRRLNQDALRDPRVRIVNADAFAWLEASTGSWDFAVVDFPDPSTFGLGKLYTTTFYRLLTRRLSPDGLFVVQSTSPLFARRSYWCIVSTIEHAGLRATPYHVYVPSFGEWGFVIAGRGGYTPPSELPGGLRFLTPGALSQAFDFPKDMARLDVEPNRLNTQALVRYYEDEWRVVNK
jgi:spermidine synthase